MWRETETDLRYASSVTRFGTYGSESEEWPSISQGSLFGSFIAVVLGRSSQDFNARVVNEALSRFHYLLRLTRGSDRRRTMAACGARATTCRRPWGGVKTDSLSEGIYGSSAPMSDNTRTARRCCDSQTNDWLEHEVGFWSF
jgi:hypothetical protein